MTQPIFSSPSGCAPDTASPVQHPSIQSCATIFRDPWGIPHIRANNLYDVFFAQGFVTAQDRLWQMDFDRLRCLGRAAEHLGDSALEQDKLMRRRDFERVSRADYELASPDAKTALDAYADGVNAFIDSDNTLPFEYQLLESQPERWQPWHCIAVYKVRNSAEGSFQAKLWIAELAARIGIERVQELSPGYQNGMYLTVPPGAKHRGMPRNILEELRAIVNLNPLWRELDGGSNGWAVSGELTQSGLPMVGGDSHRLLEMPNVYYQVHLATEEFDVIGHSIPGMPMVMHFAHNRYVAWGMTHGGIDTQDLYLEKLERQANQIRYSFKNQWQDTEYSTETIKIRGSDPLKIEKIRTHHGPIITNDIESGYGIALADPGSNDPTPWVDAALNAMQAKNADEFEQALAGWTDRVNNYPYADIHGNFGYALKGRIPIRKHINGWGPVPGWDGKHEWDGFIPDAELPRSRNPEISWAVTCNQRVVGEEYPYFLTATFGPDYRASRIISHIKAAKQQGKKLEISDMAAFHADTTSIPAQAMVDRIKSLALPKHAPKHLKTAHRVLSAWDCSLDADSVAATLCAEFYDEVTLALMERCYRIDREEFATNPDLSALNHLKRQLMPAFITALRNCKAEIFLNNGESLDDFILNALSAAAEKMTETHGAVDATAWGEMHITHQKHPLSAVFPDQAHLLDAPAIGTAGDGDVPFATGSRPLFDHRTGSGPVNRYLHSPADWSESRWIVPLGVSGSSASPHFDDQQPLWADVQYVPQLFDWRDIEAKAVSKQVINRNQLT